MVDVEDAAALAETKLAQALPRRWRHVRSVARRARWVAKTLGLPDDLVAAAWLHDIGYAPDLAETGFHPLDGARFLRKGGADDRLACLVAHHSCAVYEARVRGLADVLLAEFPPEDSATYDALVFSDMTTGPHGQHVTYTERIKEIRERYGPDHEVSRALELSEPDLSATYWLREVVEPNLAPKTTERYALLTRLYLVPGLGVKRLDRLQVRDVRTWLNRLRTTCQCCAQGKDAARPIDRRRCCAIGICCHQVLAERTVKDVRDTLRAALANAVAEELLARNVAAVVRLPTPRKQQRQWWSVEEARAFLESARRDHDPLYAVYVLIVVLGLRRGEALGLTWRDVSFEAAEIHVRWQLQRADHQLRHRETKRQARPLYCRFRTSA
ncbi:MAG TPA: HD domain-containing protein [Streptosporangiaceae bacterium]|nr:HD domain-containing protein [Streptosporangiaceae bacterium]